MLSKWDVLRINLAAGLIAGAIIGIGEIVIGEVRTRMKAHALTASLETETAADGSGTEE